MAENKKVPEIRFKGFTEDWEQCKLGDIGYFRSNGVDKKINENEIKVNMLNYMDVYNSKKINNTNVKSLMQVTAKINQIMECNIEKNDIFFTPTSETADDIGHVLVIEEKLENTVYSYHLMRYRPNNGEFYSTFPNYGFSTKNIRKQMRVVAKGVQRFVISKPDFEQLEIRRPKFEEQKKIADFMTNIDNFITLHQSKYEKLVNVKKSMLEKMFPKNSLKIPEIRFKGFTEDWDQRKLEEIVDFYRGYGLSWNDINENGVNKCILYGNLYTDYGMVINEVLRSTNNNKNEYFLSEVGDVLIPSSDTTPTGLARASALNLKGIILGGDINILRPKNINGPFLSYTINNNREELIKRIKGTTVRHLNNSDINDMYLNITSNIKEQEKIASLLTNLDNLITLHQCKLEKLNNIKKSMLDKMFV